MFPHVENWADFMLGAACSCVVILAMMIVVAVLGMAAESETPPTLGPPKLPRSDYAGTVPL